jgi:hypothetical protein
MSRCEANASPKVFDFKIRHFFQNLSSGKPCREEIENVTDANAHPTNAWPSATLLGIGGDSIGKLIHCTIVPAATKDRRSDPPGFPVPS